jgi:hypothetical protein
MPLIVETISGGNTLADFRSLVQGYGFNHFSDARLDELVTDAVSELHNEGDWPYKEGEESGALPLTIDGLSQVEYVRYNGVPYGVVERRWLEERVPDLSVSGAPLYFWIDAGQILRSYPVSAVEVTVRYFSTHCWETAGVTSEAPSGDTSECLIPVRFQGLVTLLAVGNAYLEDEQEDAVGFLTRYEKRLEQMRYQLLSVNRDAPREVRTGFNTY